MLWIRYEFWLQFTIQTLWVINKVLSSRPKTIFSTSIFIAALLWSSQRMEICMKRLRYTIRIIRNLVNNKFGVLWSKLQEDWRLCMISKFYIEISKAQMSSCLQVALSNLEIWMSPKWQGIWPKLKQVRHIMQVHRSGKIYLMIKNQIFGP